MTGQSVSRDWRSPPRARGDTSSGKGEWCCASSIITSVGWRNPRAGGSGNKMNYFFIFVNLHRLDEIHGVDAENIMLTL